MGPDSIVFSPFFFFVFQKKCDNSKHTNLDFFFFSLWKAEDSSVNRNLFSLFVIFGTCRVKPRGNETLSFFFLVHSARHDAPINRQRGQNERVKGHSVPQRRISRHSGTNNIHNSWTICLLPVVTILLSQIFFFQGGGKDFIHLIINRIMNFMHVKITHKGNTWSQCNPNKSSVLLLWYEQFRKNPTFRYSVSVFGEPTFTYQSFLTFPRGLCNGTHRTGVKVLLLIKPTVCSIPPPNSNCSIIAY